MQRDGSFRRVGGRAYKLDAMERDTCNKQEKKGGGAGWEEEERED